jgi:hypothetical protein
MSRLHFFGWLIIVGCLLLMAGIFWSRPAAGFGFLNGTDHPVVGYEDREITLTFYPRAAAQDIRHAMDSELRSQGFELYESPDEYTQYRRGAESFTLIPREGGGNPRIQLAYRRPASVIEILFHPFWDG